MPTEETGVSKTCTNSTDFSDVCTVHTSVVALSIFHKFAGFKRFVSGGSLKKNEPKAIIFCSPFLSVATFGTVLAFVHFLLVPLPSLRRRFLVETTTLCMRRRLLAAVHILAASTSLACSRQTRTKNTWTCGCEFQGIHLSVGFQIDSRFGCGIRFAC